MPWCQAPNEIWHWVRSKGGLITGEKYIPCGLTEFSWIAGPRDGRDVIVGPNICEVCLVAYDKSLTSMLEYYDKKEADRKALKALQEKYVPIMMEMYDEQIKELKGRIKNAQADYPGCDISRLEERIKDCEASKELVKRSFPQYVR